VAPPAAAVVVRLFWLSASNPTLGAKLHLLFTTEARRKAGVAADLRG